MSSFSDKLLHIPTSHDTCRIYGEITRTLTLLGGCPGTETKHTIVITITYIITKVTYTEEKIQTFLTKDE